MNNQTETLTPELTMENLLKYLDLKEELAQHQANLKQKETYMSKGKVGQGEPYATTHDIKVIVEIEKLIEETQAKMTAIYDELDTAYTPKTISIKDHWISTGKNFYFKLIKGKIEFLDHRSFREMQR